MRRRRLVHVLEAVLDVSDVLLHGHLRHHGGGGGMSMMSLEDTPGAFYEKLKKSEKIVGRTYAGKPVYEVCQAIAGKMQCRIVDERGDRVYSHQYAKK